MRWLALVASILLWGALPAASLAEPMIELKAPEGLAEESRRLVLNPPAKSAWQAVRVDWLAVRSTAGQRSIPAMLVTKDQPLEFELQETGCSLLVADIAPSAAAGGKRRPSYSTKIVSCRFAAGTTDSVTARRGAAQVLTSKTGSRIELRPLLNPALLRVGSDLPIRAYFEGSSAAGAELVAVTEDGSEHRALTDSVGIAALSLDRPGRWVVAFERRQKSGTEPSVGELVFEVLDEAAWQRLSAEGR